MYPAAPWHLHGQLWLSVFRASPDGADRASPHVVALARYEHPSPLTYAELMVVRPVARPLRGVSIDPIWVDSPGLGGGRELWAIPKGLAEFDERAEDGLLLHRTHWRVSHDGGPVARVRFSDVSRVAPRVPFRGTCWQPGLGDGPRTARVTGSGRAAPCRARWDFAPDGPLGWLAGHRPVGSMRLRDFEMSFGEASPLPA